MTAPLIALLDDEPEIRVLLASALEEAGFRTVAFGRVAEFETGLRRITPDVCLVDLGLPDQDGLALVWRLARETGAAIIIISGRARVQDRITGLELGADDYITKPFDPAEVVTRVRVLLRRGRARPETPLARARFSGWQADFDRHLLTAPDGEDAALSRAEGALLRLFLDQPNRLLSREQMQDRLGGGAGSGFDRAMDVRISRLRVKLREDPRNPRFIKTIYGAGYIFVGDVDWR
ncbi:response regulator transcription factor [Paroceanicella profunda]|uniref:Response regulator transcription factor n=1 Tax=Paroceanicella profunda TaxID=2579971 RepID=A0A5B8G1E9_9RHOB|nr:response regulator transcription factor [Paroceanicella profunda]QDL92303.1 response regulator transcription factor [Paroceanicella profunda]